MRLVAAFRAAVAAVLLALGLPAQATTFFAWGAECTHPCTNSATGSLYPFGEPFTLRPGPNTSISTSIKHSGNASLKTVSIGNDGGNQPEGSYPIYNGFYSIHYPGGFLGSTRYYRWWMRIEPGWSWGNSGIGDPVFKVIRESLDSKQWYTILMTPSGFQFDDCDDDGVGGTHAGECWDNTGAHNSSSGGRMGVSYTHPTDGVWREYILKIKQPTSSGCTPGAGCNSEFTLYIDGTQVSTNTGWKIVPESGAQDKAGDHFGATTGPYFQIRSSVAAGGTIYWDDFSVDDVFNSIAGGGSAAAECSNWQAAHPTWIWCDAFETDQSANWWDYNAGAATPFARSAGNGRDGSYSMRATFPNTTGAASGGDFKVVFGDTAYTPNVKASADVTELYWRAWIRHSVNWAPGDGWKFTRAVGCASSAGYCPNQSFMAHWWASNASYSNFLGIDPASGVSGSTVVTTTWNDTANFTWLGAVAGTAATMSAARANTWQCIEGHLKLNALGASDGVQEMWVDGVLEAQRTGMNLRGSYAGTYNGINMFSVENYENAGLALSGRTRDWDNLVIATDRVGCYTGGSQLPAPVTFQRVPR